MLNGVYREMFYFIQEISANINDMHDICPEVFLRMNQEDILEGNAILTYRVPNMYIELDIPHDYAFEKAMNKSDLACMLVHEYCHYIDALSMSGQERTRNINRYINDLAHRRLQEQRNWTATKKLAKALGLWKPSFYKATRRYRYTTALRY